MNTTQAYRIHKYSVEQYVHDQKLTRLHKHDLLILMDVCVTYLFKDYTLLCSWHPIDSIIPARCVNSEVPSHQEQLHVASSPAPPLHLIPRLPDLFRGAWGQGYVTCTCRTMHNVLNKRGALISGTLLYAATCRTMHTAHVYGVLINLI